MGIYKKGKDYFIDYYVHGRRKREKVGASRRLAETALGKRKAEIAEGKFLDIKRKPKIEFSTVAKRFLEYSRVNRSSGTYQYHYYNLKPLLEFFGNRLLGEISPPSVEDYKKERLQEVCAVTLNHEIAVLKNILNRAVEWGFLEKNPVSSVKKVPEKGNRLRYLSFEEISKLLEVCQGNLRVIVSIAMQTGMRKSEILNLKWKDIDFEHLLIHLDETKSGNRRDLPIRQGLAEIIQSLPKNGSPYIFDNGGVPVRSVKTAYHTALKRAGIEDCRFHDLRHTFASHLVMSGVDLATVKELMGHSSIEMTMRYAHLSPDHRRLAIENLGSKMDTFWTPETKTDLLESCKPV